MTSVIDVLNTTYIPEVYVKSEPLLSPVQKVISVAVICLFILIFFSSKFGIKTLLRLKFLK